MFDSVFKLIRQGFYQENFTHVEFIVFNLYKNELFKKFRFVNAHSAYLKDRGYKGNPNDWFYFDLSSLTKPLVLTTLYLMNKELFGKDELLLLEHRGGIPSGGLLPPPAYRKIRDYRDLLKEFPISPSATLYSDYGFLRLMLELQEKMTEKIEDIILNFYSKNLFFWNDPQTLSNSHFKWSCVPTGEGDRVPLQGIVHDPNARRLNTFCTHAGMFASSEGLLASLVKMEKQLQLVKNIKERKTILEKLNPNIYQRYLLGMDTVEKPEETLAGIGATRDVFGHLGFTGVSFWIDSQDGFGYLLLTNCTIKSWHERKILNQLRRELGRVVFKEKENILR